MRLTAFCEKVSEGCIAVVEDLASVNAEGPTLDEVCPNLRESVGLVVEDDRQLAREAAGTGDILRELLMIEG